MTFEGPLTEARKRLTSAQRAVDTILAELSDRKGIGDVLDDIKEDDEVWDDLRNGLVKIVVAEFEP
jgi:hypothetical protein